MLPMKGRTIKDKKQTQEMRSKGEKNRGFRNVQKAGEKLNSG